MLDDLPVHPSHEAVYRIRVCRFVKASRTRNASPGIRAILQAIRPRSENLPFATGADLVRRVSEKDWLAVDLERAQAAANLGDDGDSRSVRDLELPPGGRASRIGRGGLTGLQIGGHVSIW
jgi:hypothetical protein